MGAGASVKQRSKSALTRELDRETEQKYKSITEAEELLAKRELEHAAIVDELRAEKNHAEANLAQVQDTLERESKKWRKDKNEALHMMFSDLPLVQLSQSSKSAALSPRMFSGCSDSLCKEFPTVTIASWDVVGFAELCSQLKPAEIVAVLDDLNSRADKTFADPNIVILDRLSDNSTAATGLVERYTKNSCDDDIQSDEYAEAPSAFARLLVTCCLRLMSSVPAIAIPRHAGSLLQLRIAIHVGPCSAGAIGLQSDDRLPRYRLFGPTVTMVNWLRSTSLALQIRVSRACKELLFQNGVGDDFALERCPDYTVKNGREVVESYWLTGIVGENDLRLPPLEKSLSLSQYTDF